MDINIRLPIMDHVLGRCHFTRQHDTESGHSKSHRADKVRGKSTFMATRRMDARNRYCTKSQQKQEGKMKGNKQRTPKRIELQASNVFGSRKGTKKDICVQDCRGKKQRAYATGVLNP